MSLPRFDVYILKEEYYGDISSVLEDLPLKFYFNNNKYFYIRTQKSIEGMPYKCLDELSSIDSYSVCLSSKITKNFHCFYSSKNFTINNITSDKYFEKNSLLGIMREVKKIELLKNYCDNEKFIKNKDKFEIQKGDINWKKIVDKLVENKIIETKNNNMGNIYDNDGREIVTIKGENINNILVDNLLNKRYDIVQDFNKEKLIELYEKQFSWFSYEKCIIL